MDINTESQTSGCQYWCALSSWIPSFVPHCHYYMYQVFLLVTITTCIKCSYWSTYLSLKNVLNTTSIWWTKWGKMKISCSIFFLYTALSTKHKPTFSFKSWIGPLLKIEEAFKFIFIFSVHPKYLGKNLQHLIQYSLPQLYRHLKESILPTPGEEI